MNWWQERERQAAQEWAAMLALPIESETGDSDDEFDPWPYFGIYGGYSSEFDDLAIAVLRDVKDFTFTRADLASEMFREMLCFKGLCDYGTSPRACFPSSEFAALLPQTIEKWEAFRAHRWADTP